MSSSLGDKILTLRRSKGLTQEALAAKLGVTQAALSRWEHGLREIDADTLSLIARTLGVTPEFLNYDMQMKGGVAVEAHMRRQKTANVADWKRIESVLNIERIRAAFVFDRISIITKNGLPTLPIEEYTPAEAARTVRGMWQMPMGEVKNLTQWLESAGVIIIEKNFDTTRVDAMSQWASAHPVVLVNSTFSTDRKRLTLAHELGHLVMHSSTHEPEAEEQANQFAAEFLMPEQHIKGELEKSVSVRNLMRLKMIYGVSMQALFERAYQLEIVTQTDRTNFYKMMAKRGWRKNEPQSDALPKESPTTYKRIVSELEKIGLKEKERKTILGLDAEAEHELFATETLLRLVA